MIIGLTGYKGSGKSEVARVLGELGFVRQRFAGPLKDMLRAIGLTDEQLDGSEKEIPCDLLGGVTPRHAMQTLGTEWGRNCIHPQFWTMLWKARALAHPLVVVDDIRFPNEAEIVRSLGGMVWRVDRGQASADAHVSEQHIATLPVDRAIQNAGTLLELAEAVRLIAWRDLDIAA